MRHATCRLLVLALLAVLLPSAVDGSPPVRIKDLTDIEGVRSNPLLGYGLVVGLQGTGDGTQARFTIQSIANALRNNGVSVPLGAIRVKNVAAVMVTADLPPFARPGQRLDAVVSSIGDAKSLQGGTLLMTALNDAQGNTYAVAQGAVSIGGAFLGGGGGNAVQKNHPTTGRIVSGATVERAVDLELDKLPAYRLLLRQPDLETAGRIAKAVNEHFGETVARAEDPVGVRLRMPPSIGNDPVTMLSRVEAIQVRPDRAARVAINEKTGTVVMGSEVRISKVALAHGSLTIEVRTELEASQPLPFSEGETRVLPQREVFATEGPNSVLTIEDGISVGDLVNALNAIGVTARDMIAIFQTIEAAGALHAELVLM